MKPIWSFLTFGLVVTVPFIVLPEAPRLPTQEKPPGKVKRKTLGKTPQAWTLKEALAQLEMHPRDPYLQYVTLQLARREKRLDEIAKKVDELLFGSSGLPGLPLPDRRNRVDLFSLFTGALAVQESLQLDTMRGGQRPQEGLAPGEKPDPKKEAERAKRRKEVVAVSSLKGPAVKSHPWETLLAGKQPDVSPLSRCVPADFYLAEFRSLNKLLDSLEVSALWEKYLLTQGGQEARAQQVGERLRRQLAVQTSDALRPFYDLVVEEVAVTGSDLFLREGSDVTLLFRFKQPQVFKARMDGFLESAAKGHADARRQSGKIGGVEYVHLSTPDRSVNVFAA
jgi:hypothetical protein